MLEGLLLLIEFLSVSKGETTHHSLTASRPRLDIRGCIHEMSRFGPGADEHF